MDSPLASGCRFLLCPGLLHATSSASRRLGQVMRDKKVFFHYIVKEVSHNASGLATYLQLSPWSM